MHLESIRARHGSSVTDYRRMRGEELVMVVSEALPAVTRCHYRRYDDQAHAAIGPLAYVECDGPECSVVVILHSGSAPQMERGVCRQTERQSPCYAHFL